MPLSKWVTVFSGPLFRKRLEPDYLSHLQEYASELFLSRRGRGQFLKYQWLACYGNFFADIAQHAPTRRRRGTAFSETISVAAAGEAGRYALNIMDGDTNE